MHFFESQRARRRVGLVAVGAAAATLLAGCVSAAPGGDPSASGSTDPIIIGAAIGQSGDFSSYDMPPLNMFQIWVDQTNKAGGINGRQIELKIADTKSEASQGPVAAQQLLDEGASVILVSCDFDWGSPAATTAIAAGKLAVSLCAGTSQFGPAALGALAYSAGTPAETEAAAMAEWAIKAKPAKKVFLLTDDTITYDEAWSAAFKTAWTGVGGTIAGEAIFKNADVSIADQIAQIKNSGAEAVALASYNPGGAAAVRQLRAAGVDIPIYTNTSFESTEWLTSVPDLTDFYYTATGSLNGDDPRAELNALLKEYKSGYGEAPTSKIYLGYYLGELLKTAIERSNGDLSGEALNKALESEGIKTILDTTVFDATNHIDRSRPQMIGEHSGGKTSLIELVTPTDVPQPAK